MSDKNKEIINCGLSYAKPRRVDFLFQCPVSWANMEQDSDDERKRFCQNCERHVFLCHNTIEAALRAEQGECIAVPDWLVEGAREAQHTREGILIAGQPKPTKELFEEIAAAKMNEGQMNAKSYDESQRN